MSRQVFNNVEIVWNQVDKIVEVKVGDDVVETHIARDKKEARRVMNRLEEALYETCCSMEM
jgi:hypothetical protein